MIMYTKEELIEAMSKYNKNYLNREETKESFGEIEDTIECATNQVEYLLAFIVKD